jgi:orotate phosphoribosyltransferase
MDVVSALYEAEVIKLGWFTLKSGQRSPVYLDLRLAPSNPALFDALIELGLAKMAGLPVDSVVGVATGGLVWSSVLAYRARLPHFYVRDQAKSHGTQSQVEGGSPQRYRDPILVDDVATSGTSLVHAAQALHALGLKPKRALVIVDREQGAATLLESQGIRLHSCLTMTEILEGLRGRLPEDQFRGVLEWHLEQKSRAGSTGM